MEEGHNLREALACVWGFLSLWATSAYLETDWQPQGVGHLPEPSDQTSSLCLSEKEAGAQPAVPRLVAVLYSVNHWLHLREA